MHPPKFTKFRKHQKGRTKRIESNTSKICFGKYAIRSLVNGRLRSSTIEAGRRVITRRLKRSGQVWVRVYPDLPITAKPSSARMGKGKGSTEYWGCRIKTGQILYEIDGVNMTLAQEAASLAAERLPLKVAFKSC